MVGFGLGVDFSSSFFFLLSLSLFVQKLLILNSKRNISSGYQVFSSEGHYEGLANLGTLTEYLCLGTPSVPPTPYFWTKGLKAGWDSAEWKLINHLSLFLQNVLALEVRNVEWGMPHDLNILQSHIL